MTAPLYHQDALSSFQQGARLDLRVRVAIQLLTSPIGAEIFKRYYEVLDSGVKVEGGLPAVALDIAEHLFDVGAKRGWVTPMPETSVLNADERLFAERQVNVQLHQQAHANREQAKTAPVVQAPFAGRQ